MPYIPAAEPVVAAAKPKSASKYVSYDDDEFEGLHTTHAEREKPVEASEPLQQCTSLPSLSSSYVSLYSHSPPPSDPSLFWQYYCFPYLVARYARFNLVSPFPVKPAAVPMPLAYNYIVEIGSTLFLVAFALNYMIGRKTNEKIASTFARTFRELFSSEFSVVGTNGAVLVKESQHTFRLNATGRSHVQGIQVNLRLARRQDLLARLYNQFWTPGRDLVDIQIAMNEEALDTIVFALSKNRDARDITKSFPDLSAYTKSVKIPQEQPKTESTLDSAVWTAMAETKEIVPLLFDASTKTILNRYKEQVRLVHITDQYSEHKEYKKVLQLVFYMPPIDRMEELRSLMKMTFHMIDTLAKTKLPATVKQTIEKARAKVVTDEQKEAMEQRKEELEKQKLEKRREKMKNMNANERADFEEKEKARKMNKRMKKVAIKA